MLIETKYGHELATAISKQGVKYYLLLSRALSSLILVSSPSGLYAHMSLTIGSSSALLVLCE